MSLTKRLKLDLEEVKSYFPKLNFFVKDNLKFLKGELDICDSKGTYWDTYEVIVVIPKKYPYAVPLLYESSGKIKRDDDLHLSENGQCCVEFDHKLLYRARRGISILTFIREYVYPFLANQLFHETEGNFANGEYAHHFDGKIQFYKEDLGFENTTIIIKVLDAILNNNLPSRNDLCICRKKKYKNCHQPQVEFLKTVGKDTVEIDLVEFKKLHDIGIPQNLTTINKCVK